MRVGKGAGQTVPHVHFNIVPRPREGKGSEMTDAERKNIALWERPREKLSAEEGMELSKFVRAEIENEVEKFKSEGALSDFGGMDGELWATIGEKELGL